MARARATAIAAARRGRRPFAALRLLTHAVAVAGVAQRVVAVVGARTVARGRGIRALALGRGLAVGRGCAAVRRRFASGSRRPGANAALPRPFAAVARRHVPGRGLARAALEGLRGALAGGVARARRGCRAGRPAVARSALALAVEALAAARIGVGRVAATLRVVLPGHAVAIGIAGVDALVDVDVVVAVDVDVDVVAAPVETAPQGIDRRHPQAEADAGHQRGGERRAGRWRVVGGRIGGIGPGAVDHGGVVAGHVDHLRIGRLDHHHGLAARIGSRDLLLRRAVQVACLARLRPQPLDRVHHVVRLRQEGVAQRPDPLRLAAHHVHDGRKRDQGFDARVPGLGLDRLHGRVAGLAGMPGGPQGRGRDVIGIGRPHQDLRQEGIGIERHGRQQLVQLPLVELALGRGGQARGQPEAQTAEEPRLQSTHFPFSVIATHKPQTWSEPPDTAQTIYTETGARQAPVSAVAAGA
ncbi:Uncharacterised protein [Achromobacter sp. 2789STDY5608621]|nr:Uncharacterised protein [Achromobacter sp. 2789STDY5608621]